MAIKVGDFFARLGVQVDDGQVNRAKNSFNGLNTAVKAFLASAAVLKTGQFISSAIDDVTTLGDRTAKLSRALGISAEALQTFNFAAERSGITAQDLETALGKIPRKIADAADGSKQAADTFRLLGTNAAELQQLDPEQQFLRIADGFKNLTDAGKRSTVALRLFEETGIRFIPLLSQGAEGIQAYREELESLGGLLGTDVTDASEKWRDSLTNLDRVSLGLKVQLTRAFLPTLERVADLIQDLAQTGQLAAGLEIAAKAMRGLAVVAAIVAAIFAVMHIAILPVIAAAVGLGLIFDDLIVTLQGGDSALNRFLEWLHGVEDAGAGIQFLQFVFGGLGEALADVYLWIKNVLALNFVEYVKSLTNSVGQLAAKLTGGAAGRILGGLFGGGGDVAVNTGTAGGEGGIGAVTNNVTINTNTSDPEGLGRVLNNEMNRANRRLSQQTSRP